MRLVRLVALGAGAIVLGGSAFATPMYYTFSGKLDDAYEYGSGTVATLGGYTVGVSTLTTTFVLDAAVTNVSYLWYGSTVGPYPSPYFYSAFHSGDALPVTGVQPGRESDVTFAYDGATNWWAYGSKYPGMNPNYVLVVSYSPFSSLAVGQTGFVFQSYAVDALGAGASGLAGQVTGSNFELIRVAAAPPEAVPEPGTMLLFASGLAGLIRLRRRP